MKKHDEKSAPTTVVETDAPAPAGRTADARRSSVALDAPLGSKLDPIADASLREQVAARLRLIEANLLGRLDAAALESDETGDAASADLTKTRAIAAQLKKKPQA